MLERVKTKCQCQKIKRYADILQIFEFLISNFNNFHPNTVILPRRMNIHISLLFIEREAILRDKVEKIETVIDVALPEVMVFESFRKDLRIDLVTVATADHTNRIKTDILFLVLLNDPF